jgi:hypothetical protein
MSICGRIEVSGVTAFQTLSIGLIREGGELMLGRLMFMFWNAYEYVRYYSKLTTAYIKGLKRIKTGSSNSRSKSGKG